MRMPSRKKESVFQQRRTEWLKGRAAAQTLRSAHPGVELVRVDLTFRDASPRTPAAQSYVVHPPARAFFEYPCPFADCDGKFDLGAVATEALSSPKLRAEGVLECTGLRSRDGLQKQCCGLRVHYTVTGQLIASTGSHG